MADALGTLAKAAIRKDRGLYGAGPGITFPDVPGGTDMATGHQVPFTSETLTKAIKRANDTSLVGAQGLPEAPIVEETAAGGLSCRARWRGQDRLFLFALGFEQPNGDDGSPRLIGTGEGTQVVTNTTNATPIVVTVTGHGYSDGDGVQIAGVTGNTAANGDWAIANTTANTFELIDSSGNGAHGGSPTAEKFNAAHHLFEGDNHLQDLAWETEDGRNPGFDPLDRKVRRFQVGLDKGVSDHVFYSSFINKLTLSGNPNEVTLAVELLSYNRVTGSYNSASWTLPLGSTAQVLFRQLEVQLGLRAAGAGALTVYRPNSFELAIDNGLKGDDQTTESGLNHEIPVRDGFRTTTLKLDFPRYSADTLGTAFDGDQEYAGQLEFTGPDLPSSGSTARLWGFYMSSLRFVSEGTNIAGANRVPQSVEFVAEKPGGSDIFDATKYQSITTRKDSEIVIVTRSEDPQNYLTEY
jgi:hypothetical protein